MDYSVLISLMIKVALLIISGYILKKTGILTETVEQGISGMILKFILPCSVLASAGNGFGKGMASGLLIMGASALLYYLAAIGLTGLLGRIFKLGEEKRRIFITLTVFANTAFLGYPISQELYGNEGFVYAVVYNMFYQLFFFTYGIGLIRGSREKSLRSVLVTPANLALLAMICLAAFHITLPDVLQDTLSSVGNMMVPLSMLVIGCSLVGMRPIEMLKDRQCYLVSAFRLLVYPLLALFLLRLFRVSEPIASLSVILAGLPSGSLNVIVAKQYHCEGDFAARSVVQTMVLGVVTIPFIIWLCTVI
ncbi:MAG: AEC family transporter [Lachnospiraceae bacterium]|nr:AEC family transporter [Lachnospiraceae bacterium]